MNRFDTPQSIGRLGIARRDITPPVGMYHRMWGAAKQDRSTGVHRPLTATALVFRPSAQEDDDVRVLVAIDHCLLMSREMERLRDRSCSVAGLEREQLVITFSHTHAAGLLDLGRRDLPGGELLEPYVDELIEEVAGAVEEASRTVEPVTITYATGRCSLAAHRDYRDEDSGLFVCGFNPGRAADDSLLVARATATDRRVVATLINYACHPTTLAWENTLISPDYPGAARGVVEEASGAPCVFLQGASGDLGPRDGFVGDAAVADRNGRQLGHAALSTLDAMPPPRTTFEYAGPVTSGATLGTWRHRALDESELRSTSLWTTRDWTIDLAYRDDLPRLEDVRAELERSQAEEHRAQAVADPGAAREARALAERASRQVARLGQLPGGSRAYPYRVNLWRFGDAVWLGVEGEPYSQLQIELRQRFPTVPIVVIELTNGWLPSYLPSREIYGQGIYQEQIALLEAGSLERLIESVSGELERLSC